MKPVEFALGFGVFVTCLGKIEWNNLNLFDCLQTAASIVLNTYFDWQHPIPGPDIWKILQVNDLDIDNTLNAIAPLCGEGWSFGVKQGSI